MSELAPDRNRSTGAELNTHFLAEGLSGSRSGFGARERLIRVNAYRPCGRAVAIPRYHLEMVLNLDALSAKLPELLLDPVVVVDESGRFVYVNAACERVLGYARADLIGYPKQCCAVPMPICTV